MKRPVLALLLLLALALYSGVTESVTSLLVKQGLASGNVTVRAGLHIDVPIVFVGLVLVAMAEIFRRGAELEDEQSLVI